ncbi:platelet glycoprotein V-like [Schistocerca serialis cubense]|uniref:platelet glycoprotein V-like n=1 Tax=Schistocerca serialis cubense TaxID=2023355 RepID=UPI00214EFC34|nr:platelet glycoprotein V-like [Schistocerca serialis cubense]
MNLQKALVCLVLMMTTAMSATLTCPCKLSAVDDRTIADCANWDLLEVPSCVPNDTTILEFSGNNLPELDTNLVVHMPQLRHLDADRSHITSVSVTAFTATPELRKVQLSHNNIRQIPAGLFDATPLLEVVVLSGNMLYSLPRGLFKKVPHLRRLELNSNYLSTLPDDLLAGCGQQAVLRVDTNHLTTLPAPLISSCSSMVELDASSNEMRVLPVDVVAAIGQLSHLDTLRLHDNPWQCDCTLSPLAELLQTHDSLDQQLTCDGPRAVRERHVVHVVSGLDCAPQNSTMPPAVRAPHRGHPPATTGTNVGTIVVVALVVTCCTIAAVGAFFTVRRHRRKAVDKSGLLVTEDA